MSLCGSFYYFNNQQEVIEIAHMCDWFTYRYFESIYKDSEFVEESIIDCPVSPLQLLDLHSSACHKLYQEQLDLNLKEQDETISTYAINSIKEVIRFSQQHPSVFIFYEAGY